MDAILSFLFSGKETKDTTSFFKRKMQRMFFVSSKEPNTTWDISFTPRSLTSTNPVTTCCPKGHPAVLSKVMDSRQNVVNDSGLVLVRFLGL